MSVTHATQQWEEEAERQYQEYLANRKARFQEAWARAQEEETR